MADKLVSPGPRQWLEGDGKSLSKAGATTLDRLIKMVQRIQALDGVTVADADNPAGAQALANENKERINQILEAFGVVVGDDDPPVESPEEAEASQPAYVQVKDVYTRDEVTPSFGGGLTYSYAAGTAPDLSADRNRIDPVSLDFSTLQSDGARLEIEYRAALVGGKATDSPTIALLVDGVVTDWTVVAGEDNSNINATAMFILDQDSAVHTYSIAIFQSDASTVIEDWSRRILLIRERRNT